MPSHLPAELRRRLLPVRLVILDVDGVLTDGRLLFGPDGESLKQFNVRDGFGIRALLESGIQVAVLSGRASAALDVRCRELGLRQDLVRTGSRDKGVDLAAIEAAARVAPHEMAAIGDDLPDLPMLSRVGLAICPADAAPEVAAVCDLVLGSAGGAGAVRETAELVLKAQGRWAELVQRLSGTTAEGVGAGT